MIYQEFELAHQGLKLQAHHWEPQVSNGKSIGIIHGLGEHGKRYANLASYFCELGYHVFAFDHQGHGKSSGAQGTIRSWSDVLAEIGSFYSAIHGALDQVDEVILWGHSMGGLALLDYLCSSAIPKQVKTAIITSPPLVLASPPPGILVALSSLADRLVPNLTKSNELDPAHLSKDEKVVADYIADPLVHDKVSMRLGNALLKTAQRLMNHSQTIPISVLLMHGDQDQICDVKGSKDFAQKVNGPVDLKIWEDLFHEIHNEPNQKEVFTYANSWLNQKINK